MGSGKSTLGRKLAKELGTYFIDTDSLIEHFENMSIPEIFEKEGEKGFRKKEKECFEWIKNYVKNTVVSVGGGFPVYIPEIKEAGKVFYLKVPFETILKRLSDEEIKNRPLFQDINTAKKLYEKRDKIYEKLADYIIENEDINASVNKIKEILCK
jgi:shikimate kinase